MQHLQPSRTVYKTNGRFYPALCRGIVSTTGASFIKALFKRDVNYLKRDMLSLPARMGGMGLFKPTEECIVSGTNSAFISAPLVKLIQRQEYDFDPNELAEEMKSMRAEVDKEMDARNKAKRDAI